MVVLIYLSIEKTLMPKLQVITDHANTRAVLLRVHAQQNLVTNYSMRNS